MSIPASATTPHRGGLCALVPRPALCLEGEAKQRSQAPTGERTRITALAEERSRQRHATQPLLVDPHDPMRQFAEAEIQRRLAENASRSTVE